jgi:hypothetical protein
MMPEASAVSPEAGVHEGVAKTAEYTSVTSHIFQKLGLGAFQDLENAPKYFK